MESNKGDSSVFFAGAATFAIILITVWMNPDILGSKPRLAPDFQGTDLQGGFHSLKKYSGELLVLYFGGNACGVSKIEVPRSAKVYEEFAPRGVRFLGIDPGSDCDAIRDFVKNNHISYPVICSGQEGMDRIKWAYGAALKKIIITYPYYVIISNGKIVRQGTYADSLRHDLEDILKAPR